MPLLEIVSAALDFVLGLFGAGLLDPTESMAFLCLTPIEMVGTLESSVASSPDASLEDGCRRSTVEVFSGFSVDAGILFRLGDNEEDDMSASLVSMEKDMK